MNGTREQRSILFCRLMEEESNLQRETFKSILLSVLVLASVAMTWNIWFYKTDYQNYKGPSESVKQVAIAESREASDVIRPYLILRHTGGLTSGQTENSEIMKAYRLIQNASFIHAYPIFSRKNIPARDGLTSYEIIFPAPLTQETLKKVFQFDQNDLSLPNNVRMDRLEVYPSLLKGRPLVAVFRTQDGTARFYAVINRINVDDLQQVLTNRNWIPYSRQDLMKKRVYLPAVQTKLSGIMTYYEDIPISSFIPALFNDPNNVFYNRGETAYSDGTRQLEKTGNILQYVNPGISSGSQGETDPILHSFDFINNFKGWTDDYMYDGITSSVRNQQDEVVFRMRLGDHLVYNTEYYPNPYLTTMELIWKNGELSNLYRTLLNLNPIDEQGTVSLDSGEEMLQKLRAASVPVNEIQDMDIGYRLTRPQQGNGHYLVLTPDWFYKMDNRWYSATDATIPLNVKNEKRNLQ
ncbi:hypothetical protein EWI07_11390 [Sporolactobacillus sp. THM7-4]|nr:hypothetical protein EWI07_11390 [Sporolactobacillus sp. THM7-4]